MITGIALAATGLAVASFALASQAQNTETKATLYFVGVFFVLVSAALPGLREQRRRHHKAALGRFLQRALDLSRECDNSALNFATTKQKCDVLENEQDAYVLKHFGPADVSLLNNSQGVTIHAFAGILMPEQRKYSNWCRYRAARLTEMISRL